MKKSILVVLVLLLIIAGCGGGCGGGGGSTAATGGALPNGSSSDWQTVWTAGWAISPFDAFLAKLDLQTIANAQGPGNHMRGIHAYNDNIVISVGDNGTIEISTDGGSNWIDRSTDSDQLRDCKSPDGNEVWVAGMSGATLPSLKKSTNGGINFANQAIAGKTPANISHIHKISMPLVNTFWAACEGGVILRQNDGTLLGTGRTQSNLENGTGNGFANVNGIYAVTADEAWFHNANGDLWRTIDRLATEATYMGNFVSCKDVHVRGTNVWLVGANGRIQYSANSGGNWTQQTNVTGLPVGVLLNDITLQKIAFQNNNKGLAVGYVTATNAAVILETNNSGGTWIYDAPASSATGAMNAVSISPNGRAFGAERAHIVRSQL